MHYWCFLKADIMIKITPVNISRKPIGRRKNASCKNPCASINSGVNAFIIMQIKPMRSKVTPAVQSFFLIILHLHNQSFVFTDLLPSAISHPTLSRQPIPTNNCGAPLRSHPPSAISLRLRRFPSSCADYLLTCSSILGLLKSGISMFFNHRQIPSFFIDTTCWL